MFLPPLQQVLVTGGYGQEEDESYSGSGFLFSLETGKWEERSYLTPAGGRRSDHVCGTVSWNAQEKKRNQENMGNQDFFLCASGSLS